MQKIFIYISVIVLFCAPLSIFAEGTTYHFLAPLPASDQFCSEEDMADGLCNELSEDFSLGNYVNGFFRIGIALAGVLAVIMFVVGGITYMMSAVVGQKESAKGMMGNALLGLLLALGSYAILNTINPTLTQFNLFGGENETIGGGGQQQEGEDTVNPGGTCSQQFQEGSTWPPQNVQSPNTDAEIRQILLTNGIPINKANCQTVGSQNCTSLDGLSSTAVNGLIALKQACPTCDITVTGGTECWLHGANTAHMPGNAVVDLSRTSSLLNFIQNNSSAPTDVGYGEQYTINNSVQGLGGARFVDESSSDPHFHIPSW